MLVVAYFYLPFVHLQTFSDCQLHSFIWCMARFQLHISYGEPLHLQCTLLRTGSFWVAEKVFKCIMVMFLLTKYFHTEYFQAFCCAFWSLISEVMFRRSISLCHATLNSGMKPQSVCTTFSWQEPFVTSLSKYKIIPSICNWSVSKHNSSLDEPMHNGQVGEERSLCIKDHIPFGSIANFILRTSTI